MQHLKQISFDVWQTSLGLPSGTFFNCKTIQKVKQSVLPSRINAKFRHCQKSCCPFHRGRKLERCNSEDSQDVEYKLKC